MWVVMLCKDAQTVLLHEDITLKWFSIVTALEHSWKCKVKAEIVQNRLW